MAKKIDRIDSVETLEAKLAEMRTAAAVYSKFTQEQVDEICKQAAMAADKARIPLAKMAQAETGMGVVEDKVIKNNYASEHVHNYFRHVRTCGVIEEDKAFGTKRIAEPVGIVGAVTPTTNPTSTCIFKILICLKTRNAILISPHPTAKRCTIEAARIMKEAAEKAGLPENIICWMDESSIEMTQVMMREVNLILATGGAGMVKAAYSSGTPAIGVGPGNCNVIFDDSCDIKNAVSSTIHSKTFDNGMICAAEQHVTVLDSIYDKVKKEFQDNRCYFLNQEEAVKIGEVFFNAATHGVKATAVGRSPAQLAAMAGIQIPEGTKVLIAETDDLSHDNPWANEKLCPVLGMYRAKTFEQALDICYKLVSEGGAGHSGALYVDPTEREKIDAFGAKMQTARVLINMPTSFGGIGDLYNFDTAPSLTLGPGSWGGSSFAGQTNIHQLLNIKTVAERRENMLWFRAPQKVYFKKGCLPVALREVMDKKRAFIVTDQFLYANGYAKPVTDQLDQMGIAYDVFYDVAPDPTLACAKTGAERMRAFGPDCIIAIGGGSAMDAGKIMWVMYEHPEADFMDMAMRFMDIRKRVYTFPKMGEKAAFIAVPTSAGTGSEVTPFAVITDERSGVKYPLADYELMPTMAIVDADMMMNAPKGLTAASGIDAVTHALEAYASMMATDYTDGIALRALQMIFTYLPRAYDNGPSDPEAREKMANAATMAGMAFANAFLGVCHSMAHKLGAFHHLPHGVANALMICHVLRFNAAQVPAKMGTFPQYDHPHTLERYAQVADALGIRGGNDQEKLDNLCAAIEELKARVGIKATIRDYGVDETYFLDHLDEMVEQAFDDQCTGANPRYPLMSEIKEMYLKAYYGE